MKLAIIASHPIQYYAPWFARVACEIEELKVFYLWERDGNQAHDTKFGREVIWDVPLLTGYDYQFISNSSSQPGTSSFRGLQNPSLFDEVSAFDPDAVLFTTLFYESPLKLLFKLSSMKKPILFRGDSHALVSPPRYRWLKKMIYSKLTALLAVGEANRNFYRGLGVPEEKIYFAPHAINAERFHKLSADEEVWVEEKKSELGIQDGDIVFLFVGKLEEKKRPDWLAQCFSEWNQPKAKLIFIGEGDLSGTIDSYVKKDTRILRLPFMNQSRMPAVYRLGHCLILPSSGPSETWGLCVNEAMVSGLPALISSHVGSGPDLIDEGKTGWIFEAENGAALLGCLDAAFSALPANEEMSRSIRERVEGYTYAVASRGLHEALRARV
ncbi:MAG: glycosyltransferase family 4 protein [Verrucomicrobiota bacterium]